MKRAWALFVIKVLVDDDMIKYVMGVGSPKEAWDIFASMFARKLNPKPTLDKVGC